jgi:predicted DNA-binding transcriptional regulator AlpA
MTRNATTLGEIDVASLPASLTTERAARLLGLSRVGLWGMARDGDAPVPFFHAGAAIRWPTAPILRLLGLSDDEGSGPGPAGTSPEGTERDSASTAAAG